MIVNVGDDTVVHGLAISPDIDTVIYALAGVEGRFGWGRRDDTFAFNEELARFGIDNSFALGDLDLALKVARTTWLASGSSLTECTKRTAEAFGVRCTVLPATDHKVSTEILTDNGWISFREYFVARRHRDRVLNLRYQGIGNACPAPGVTEAISEADMIVIGPSNPPLSIWPILDIQGVRSVVASHPHVVAVSPLIGGKAVKGPVVEVMDSLGLGQGHGAVAAAYSGLLTTLVINDGEAITPNTNPDLRVEHADTMMSDLEASRRLAWEVINL